MNDDAATKILKAGALLALTAVASETLISSTSAITSLTGSEFISKLSFVFVCVPALCVLLSLSIDLLDKAAEEWLSLSNHNRFIRVFARAFIGIWVLVVVYLLVMGQFSIMINS